MSRHASTQTGGWRCGTAFRARSVALAGLMVSSPVALQAQTLLPQGGSVVSGQARISAASANALTITQNSPRAIVNWDSFSIGSNGSVNFIQPTTSSAILNRVTGSTSSSIAGAITGNGQVFLVNPNGIAITSSGTVQVGGGFVASTLDIANADFNAGNLNFAGTGASAGVSNAGSIASAPGSFVGMIGGTVSNSGTISVPLGRVGLGSGERATIDPTGDGFLQVAVPTGAVAADGRALIDVSGRVRAAGGTIEIRAATAQAAVRDAVNVSGALSARSVSGRSGSIVLDGGPGGNVVVSGKLSATGGKQGKGGSITVTGSNIGLRGALVDVSGGTGGGTVEIGGGSRGSGPLLRAATTSIDGASIIKADATVNGNGGNVTVWSDDATSFAGHISARGGPQGGNGGQAEVSGKAELNLTGDYSQTPLADLTALRGTTGTILFDPGTVNILDQTSLANQSALNGPDTFTAQFISGQLGSANVTIDTNNATGANGAAGDINLMSNAHIAWTTNNTLTLDAARNINFASGASISGTGASAGLVLRADSGGSGIGTVNFAGGTQVSLPSGSVDIEYNPASNRTVANGGSNNAAGTVNASSYTGATPAAETWSSFVTAGALRSWMLVNSVSDLQNINNSLSARYLLGTNVDASATSGWNAGAGFVPLGTDGNNNIQNSGNGFAGTFDGGGHVIDGLSIDRTSAGYIGLFGDIGPGASVANIGLTNVAITGAAQFDGSLVGYASAGSLINNSYSSGNVTGNLWVGGLVARSGGTITASYSTSTVSGAGRVGGLAGETNGTIINSYATGAVTGAVNSSYVGGLVGYSNGTVSQSYATGAVTGNSGSSDVGGLVGNNVGSISTTWSSGAVSGASNVGGLVGLNSGSISSSYFDTTTSGQASGVGGGATTGVTALTTSQAFTQSSYAGWDFANTWYMVDGQTRPFLQSEYSTDIVNAHQLQLINMSNATLGAAYTLGANIDASADGSANPAGMWSSSGFVALGTDGTGTILNGGNGFTGSLDGGGHVVQNLTINRSAYDWIGLFGYVNGGSISNVGLTNASVAGNINVGALVGVNSGDTISNAYSTGAVSGLQSVGGLVGNNNQSNTLQPGSITDSSSSAGVTGTGSGSRIGGLVGAQFNSASINSSYATGTVAAPSSTGVGGLVGENIPGTVTNSYATGAVSGGQYTGALVGVNDASSSVGTSYAAGAVSGGPSLGGLIGWNAGTAASSYFDTLATGQGSAVGTGSASGITGLTTAALQTSSLPAGFSPSVWTATNGQYPQLAWQSLGVPGTLQVIKITATDSDSGTVTYGNSAPTFSYAVTDTIGNILCSANCSAYFSGTPLIDTTYSPSNAAGSSAPGYIAQGSVVPQSGYAIQYINDTLSVAARLLTITASAQSKTYGAVAALGTSAFTTSGLVNGDSVTSATLTSAGSGAAAGVASGPYAITPSAAVGSGLSNYTISYVNGLLTVNPASISVTAVGGASTYGASPANPGLSAIGLQNGENASVLTGLSNSFGISNSSSAGSYTLSVAGTLINSNYTVASTNSGSWTVNPASISVTALGGASTYGASPSNPGLSATGLQNGESVSVLTGLSNSFGVSNTSNAGSYTLNVAGALTNSNYTVASTTNGSWTVNPASVSVTALGGSSTYGSSPANPGLSATGLQNGQNVSVLTGLANSFGITSSSSVGGYATDVTGALTNSNYTVGGTTAGSWTVNPAGLTITASNQSKTYGSGASLGTSAFTTSGLLNSDSVTAATLTSTGSSATASVLGGPYAITPSAAVGSGLSNYTISYVNGQLTVNPASINVTARGGSSTYGASPSNPGLSATGLQNGESASVLTGLSNSFGISNSSNAGSYTLNVAGALTNSNYTVASTNSGSWTVNPAPVTVTALGGSSIFGAAPANPGLSATGLQNGQGVNALTGLRNSFGITGTSSAGTYTLTVAGTLTNSNYTVAATHSGSWMVNPVSVLRGSLTDGSSHYIPGLSAAAPPVNTDIGVLSGLAHASDKLNPGNEGGVRPSSHGASPAKAGAAVPAAGTDAGILPASPAPLDLGGRAPAAAASPGIAAGSSPIANAPCSGHGAGDAAGQSGGCGAAATTRLRGLIDFALLKLNRRALVEAIDREVSEVTNFRSGPREILTIALAGTSVGLTVGVVGWLLRGGALLSALLTSMPLWRGFDPLPILVRPRRRDQEQQAPSTVDRLFDDTSTSRVSTRGPRS